jgi:hypothetical protein
MIPKHIQQTVERSDGDGSEDMGMIIDKEAVSHILFILRSQLYSNKISSPVREYASNGVDAHTEAGLKDLPIEINIPTIIDPFFRASDKGAGLTETEMDKVFRRFGKSTKRASNDSIGCLGIGAKSAFAYTDTFLVTSKTVRGTHSSIVKYSCYLDETKVGKIAILGREENPEKETGITIEIPVDPSDLVAFRDAIFSQTQFFDPQPIYKEDDETIENPLEVPVLLCEDVFRVPKGNQSKVIMGGVAYPISLENLAYKAKEDVHGVESKLSKKRVELLEEILKLNLIFRVPIGAVEVQASREALSYTPFTIKAILARCYVAWKKIEKAIAAEIAASPTVVDALFNTEHVHNKYGVSSGTHTYNGVEITDKPNFSFREGNRKPGEITAHYSFMATVARDINGRVCDPNPNDPTITVKLEEQKYRATVKIRRPESMGRGLGDGGDQSREIIPVLHDFKPYTTSDLAYRVQTLQEMFPKASIVVYSPPKTIKGLEGKRKTGLPSPVDDKTLESIYEQLTTQYFHFVFGECFGLPGETYNTKTLEELYFFFRQLGGVMLTEVPAAPKEKLIKEESTEPKVKKEKIKPLTLLETTRGGIKGEDYQGLTTHIEDLANKQVVYWLTSNDSHCPKGSTNSFEVITKKFKSYGTTFQQVTTILGWVETLGVTPILITANLDKAPELEKLLPPNWTRGQEFLKANLDQIYPKEIQYYFEMESSRITNWEKRDAFRKLAIFEPFKTLTISSSLIESKYGLKFLLLDHIPKEYKKIKTAENDPRYQTLLAEYRTRIFPVKLPDPLAEFPLVYELSSCNKIVDYGNLVLCNKQQGKTINEQEEKISLLESQIASIISQPQSTHEKTNEAISQETSSSQESEAQKVGWETDNLFEVQETAGALG